MGEILGDKFEYISNQRYLIEITDKNSGRKYYTRRIGALAKAVDDCAEYNLLSGISAEIFDTKTGAII